MSDLVTYGCIFCRSGSEERIIRELKISYSEMECITPKRVRVRRQGETELVALFPGYIFLRTSANIDYRKLIQQTDVYRLLQYSYGEWSLRGADRDIAMFMFEMKGVIGLSKACFQNDQVRILSGPLKRYEAGITKIDKRMKTAQVKIRFYNEELIIWLGFDVER